MNVVIPRPNPNGELSAGIGKVCSSFMMHLSSQFVGSTLVVHVLQISCPSSHSDLGLYLWSYNVFSNKTNRV